MPRMTKAQLADLAADAVALAKEHADRAGRGEMIPVPGKFLVTIRIERADGQFVTSSRLIRDDLLTTADDRGIEQDWAVQEVGSAFVSAYRRAAELPE